ncbi:MAG: hypothetical protein ACYSTS_07530 [Planctomycetota bacterium]
MLTKITLRHCRLLKVCLVLVLSFSILPDVVFSHEVSYNKAEIDSTFSKETNSCDEHNCPLLPDEPFHHCAVCCAVSHFYIDQLTGIILHFNNIPQSYSMDGDVLYKELFSKTLFRPPQSIL